MKKCKFIILNLIFSALAIALPVGQVFAEQITDAGTPYSHNLGFEWWVILFIVLACVGSVALIIFIIIEHIKINKRNSKSNETLPTIQQNEEITNE